ncbi:hypothetical protein SALBM311S_07095 [Streptomyces alboniger]
MRVAMTALAEAAGHGVGGVVAALPPLEAAAPKRYSNGSASALICLVLLQHLSPVSARASMIPYVRAAVRIVGRAGQSRRGPEQPSERIGEDLDVHAVAFVLPGVVRGIGGDAVDRRQGAVEDDERFGPDHLHGLGQTLPGLIEAELRPQGQEQADKGCGVPTWMASSDLGKRQG